MITDDIKIMTNRAIVSLSENKKELFSDSVHYILKQLKNEQYKEFAEFLFRKLEGSITNESKTNNFSR